MSFQGLSSLGLKNVEGSLVTIWPGQGGVAGIGLLRKIIPSNVKLE